MKRAIVVTLVGLGTVFTSHLSAEASASWGSFHQKVTYVTVEKTNYGLFKDKKFQKKVATSKQYHLKTLKSKGYYRLSDGNTYLSLYNNRNQWLGYINQKAVSQAKNEGGCGISLNRPVYVTHDNYTLWQDLEFNKKKGQSKSIYHYNVYVKPEYHHFNGNTYYSLYKKKDGQWLGYINAKGVSKKTTDHNFGDFYTSKHYMTVVKKGYGIYQDKNFRKKVSTSDQWYNKTLYSKGYYKTLDGDIYLSLYDNNNRWLGYMNQKAVSQAKNEGGIAFNINKDALVTSRHDTLWRDLAFKEKKGTTSDIYRQVVKVKPEYHHFNGQTYASLYNQQGTWLGYVNAKAIDYNAQHISDWQTLNTTLTSAIDNSQYSLYTKESREALQTVINEVQKMLQNNDVSYDEVKKATTKLEEAKKELAFDHNNWDMTIEKDNVILNQYSGTEESIVIPGEIDQKHVILNNNDDKNQLFNHNLKIKNIIFKEVNHRKVEASPVFDKAFSAMILDKLDLSGLDTKNVTSMNALFQMSQIQHIKLDTLDVSKVKSAKSMYAHVKIQDTSFNQQISQWRMPSLENAIFMFQGVGLKDGNLDLSHWQIKNIKEMDSMFSYNESLTSVNLSNWNVSNCHSISSMFDHAVKIKTIKIDDWDTNSIQDMNQLFNDCHELENISLSGWDTSNVTNMWRMFRACYMLKKLNIQHFNTKSVKNMEAMFAYCRNLETLDLANWDTSSVQNMLSMFEGCQSLQQLDVSRWNVSKVTNFSNMFKNDIKLQKLDLSQWTVDTKLSPKKEGMFDNIAVDKVVLFGNQSEYLRP